MGDELGPRTSAAPGAIAIAKSHAIYTTAILSIYDLLVHGLSNHVAWRCPTWRITELYRANLSANHLEAGVGTGFRSICLRRSSSVSPRSRRSD